MGSWDWDLVSKQWGWDEGQHRIFGVDPISFQITIENIRALIHPEDWISFVENARGMSQGARHADMSQRGDRVSCVARPRSRRYVTARPRQPVRRSAAI